MRVTRVPAGAALLLMLVAAPASASTLSFDVDDSWGYTVARYTASDGEANAVTVKQNPVTGMFVLKDAGARIKYIAGNRSAVCVIVPRKEARCNVTPGRVDADLGDGHDSFETSHISADVLGGSGNDTLTSTALPPSDPEAGGAASVRFHGDAGNDVLDAGRGYGDLWGGTGADALRGGSLTRVFYDDHTSGVSVTLNGQADDGAPGEGDDVGSGLMEVHGTSFADTMIGGDDDDTFRTGAGDDVLDGGAGDDLLDADAGDDVLTGGTGIDSLYGNEGDDLIWADDGVRDLLHCGPGVADVAHVDALDRFNTLGPCDTVFRP